MPARAPFLLERFQNSENNITGPNEAPKPAQAKETILNTELLGFHAMITPIMEMRTTVSLATLIEAFPDNLIPRQSQIMFWDTLEEAAKSCESEVDMVQARIPAKINPAIIMAAIPCSLKRMATFMISVSDWDEPSRTSMAPAFDME